MGHLRQILERRTSIRNELQAILEAHPNGDLDDQVRGRADQLELEISRLIDQERRLSMTPIGVRLGNSLIAAGAASTH